MLHVHQDISIQKMQSSLFNGIDTHVLRLDEIHPIVSGNKWFKLKYYLLEAIAQQKNTVATFGGAFSNHIVATAFACKAMNLKSVGIIRGEQPKQLSSTLQAAKEYGMELHFVSRANFVEKENLKTQFDSNFYWISEGGYGKMGMQGATNILLQYNQEKFTHIIASCGTGTMLAGLVNAAMPHQKVIGISALKGYENIHQAIQQILPADKQQHDFTILHNYHFGGYAKHPATLIDWINELWQTEQLPTDIVYTSKLLYAVKELCNNHYFTSTNQLLIIHSGGLQGNLSLPKNTLRF
jgi:1-aminocyclopropane-1-carboxylate deaminase